MNEYDNYDTTVIEDFDELVYSDYELADDISMILNG